MSKPRKMTNKAMAEVLRAARIFNVWQLCHDSAYVHVEPWSRSSHGGTFVTAPNRKINTRTPRPWYERAETQSFHNGNEALEHAFAFAVKLTGVPREQWALEPFGGRRCWVPKPVLDERVAWALANPKKGDGA